MALFLVKNKIVRANSSADARRIAGHPDWPICGIITLNPNGPSCVILDADASWPDKELSNDRQSVKANYHHFLTED